MNERPCEKFELLLIEETAGVLAPAQQAGLRAHVAACPECPRFAQGLAHVEARARLELAPKDPGDAFFVRTRNEVLAEIAAQQRLSPSALRAKPAALDLARAGERGIGAWFRRVGAWLVGERRGLFGATAGVTAALLVAVFLWPKAMRPPQRGMEPEAGAQGQVDRAVAEEPLAGQSDAEVLPEISTLSREELTTFANNLTIEGAADTDLDDDPEGVEGQVEGLSGDELRALDNQIAVATKEPKGA